MLKYLHIENIAVIEETNIEFSQGFNVLTGETGAGKSIVIDAINAVLGERTSKELIRKGCDEALVSALFGDLSDSVKEALAQYSVFPDDDGNILITRKLAINGKGMIKINSVPFTVSQLKEIAANLINIHGQHDNQALLKPELHCGFVDLLASNNELFSTYIDEFKNLNSIRKELLSLETDEDEKQRKAELLKYQIKEIEDANLKLGEYEKLKSQLTVAENFENISAVLSSLSAKLNGSDDGNGIITELKTSLKSIIALNNNSFDGLVSKLNEVTDTLYDLSSDTADYLDNSAISELNVDFINTRLDLIHRLMLKYGNSEEEILSFAKNAVKELDGIIYADKRYDELSLLLEKSKQSLIEKAQALTNSRIKSALIFEKEVSAVLEYLNMPNVRFKVKIEQGRYTKNGCDDVQFLISANKGEELKPLSKIASGGELSRTMLAIKSVLLDKDNVDTMIFDEIDSGISGFAAEKVGNQLKTVSSARQVICVTHLAQIAAKANLHLQILKSTSNERTFTNVIPLDYEGRITEIARIMSGSEITESLYNSAKELLDRSNSNENL